MIMVPEGNEMPSIVFHDSCCAIPLERRSAARILQYSARERNRSLRRVSRLLRGTNSFRYNLTDPASQNEFENLR